MAQLLASEAARLVEPTVAGSMRRHWVLVVACVIASVDLALAAALAMPREYRASVTVSSPRPSASMLQSDYQYLDSQVMLLSSRRVGDRAWDLLRGTEAGRDIRRDELVPTIGEAEIIPPSADTSQSYGTTIVTVDFTGSSPEEAQAGANALAQAYDEARTTQMEEQAAARLQGIDDAIASAGTGTDLAALERERIKALIDQTRDDALSTSITPAQKPRAPTGTSLVSLLGAGLCFGLVLGGAAAFLRASRLRQVVSVDLGFRLYGAPLLGELRAPRTKDTGTPTLQDRLVATAIAHVLAGSDTGRRLAVVASPATRWRRTWAARLALVLSERKDVAREEQAAPGDDTWDVSPRSWLRPWVRPGEILVPDLAHQGAAPWPPPDLGPGTREATASSIREVTVVDCPPPATSAQSVDLLAGCDGALVLVRADDPVRDHVELLRWLELTGTPCVGYVFAPHERRRWGRPPHRSAIRASAPSPAAANAVTTPAGVTDPARKVEDAPRPPAPLGVGSTGGTRLVPARK